MLRHILILLAIFLAFWLLLSTFRNEIHAFMFPEEAMREQQQRLFREKMDTIKTYPPQ